MPFSYLHYDVFTSEALTGNQLAVFPEAQGLSVDRMQRIAREMAFSESTFVLPAEDAGTDIRMRIFTPFKELPMAGHPTIGAAFALARLGVIGARAARFVFGLGVGPTPVDLEWEGGRLRFAWMTQPNPTFGPVIPDLQPVAAALGVRRDDIDHLAPIEQVSCGVPFLLVPMASRDAVDRISAEGDALRRLRDYTGADTPVLAFSREGGEDGATAYSRMFAPQFGIPEDPATGAASGPLGSYLVRHRMISGERARSIVSLQGVAMRRPSRIHISIAGTPDEITEVRVGGEAVLVGTGELLLDA